jgi:hypothetical protein
MAQVDEIVDGIYRTCSLPAGQYPVGFNQFLTDDQEPIHAARSQGFWMF